MTLMEYVAANHEGVLELTKELCKIPAPSNHEERRAEYCKNWMQEAGYDNAYIDDALNAICTIDVEDDNEVVLLIAHTDTVFPDMEPMHLYEEDGKLFSPGVGDNTCHVAMLLYAAKYYKETGQTPEVGIVFSANSGEESLGKGKGIRQLMKDFEGRVREVVSFDGNYDFIYDKALGGGQYRVTVKTEGGHAYNHFGNRNANQVLASMINAIYSTKLPAPSMTYNVGVINGGSIVNAIAESATMDFEYRADNNDDLRWLKAMFEDMIAFHRHMCEDIEVEVLRDGYLEGNVDPAKQAALARKAWDVVYSVFEEEPKYRAASTDCGVPLAMSIPAVCFGTYSGGGAHSRGEWLDVDSVPQGFEILMKFIDTYFA